MSTGPGLEEDTVGGIVKAGLGQLLALEFFRGNGKDNRCILRYMPWLFNPPSTIQQGYVIIYILALKPDELQIYNVYFVCF